MDTTPTSHPVSDTGRSGPVGVGVLETLIEESVGSPGRRSGRTEGRTHHQDESVLWSNFPRDQED